MIQIDAGNQGDPRPLLELLVDASGLSEADARLIIAMGGAYLGKLRCKDPEQIVRRGERFAAYYQQPLQFEQVAFDPNWVIADRDGLLVASKPAGLPTQGRRDADNTAFYELLKAGLRGYLGLHHRLDQDTSGLMVFTRETALNKDVSDLFQAQRVEKRYLGIVRSFWPFEGDEGTINAPIGPQREASGTKQVVTTAGKPAKTKIRLLADSGGWQLIEARPLTGRTHQIRVHLAHVGLPLWGDSLYGGGRGGFRLHCNKLAWPNFQALRAASYRLAPPDGFWLETPPALRAAFEAEKGAPC